MAEIFMHCDAEMPLLVCGCLWTMQIIVIPSLVIVWVAIFAALIGLCLGK